MNNKIKRYEMGRCVSCGDCNREPEDVDVDGNYMKADEVMGFIKESIEKCADDILALDRLDGVINKRGVLVTILKRHFV